MSQSSREDYIRSADEYIEGLAGKYHNLNAIEIEPLYNYQFYKDDVGDIALEIPGFYSGEPAVREFHYNGGEHAIFVRSDDQMVVCDYINKEIREALFNAEDISVIEMDTKRDYMASVITDDIDDLANEALEVHDFRFSHSFLPVINGSLVAEKTNCDCCGREALCYVPSEKKICPKCVENGRYDVFRQLETQYRVGWNPLKVFSSNPPFIDRGHPSYFWGIHCNEPGIFLGEIRYEDMVPDLMEEIRFNWCQLFGWWNGFEEDRVLKSLQEGRLNAYLFKCTECGAHFCVFNEFEAVG